jgi:LacI family transcriptional regulator
MRQLPAVTLYDVASRAGVSTATVSRVVHGLDRVRDSTRARVLEVIDELGYVPDGAAQSLSRRRKEVIGLVCVERTSPKLQYDIEAMSLLFYDEVLRGVEATIRDLGWSLMITYVNQDGDSDLPRLMALSGKVDGLLIGEGIVSPEIVARLAERIPVVLVAGSPRERVADVVTADNRTGAIALAEHLIAAHGLRRFHFVDGPENAPDATERRRALTSVLRSHQDCRLVGSSPGQFSVVSGAEAGQLLLAEPELPDVVFCANDQMAIGVLQSLTKAGVAVPGQVAVVGFDDIFPVSLCDPPLTTVHNPIRLLGERAATRLLDRIANPGLRQRVESLPVELVLRSSCGCPPGTVVRQPLQRQRGRPVKALTSSVLPAAGL